MSIWTPHDICVLIHYHVSPGQPWSYGNTMAWRDSMGRLHHYGLIDRTDEMAISTEKGQALIHCWLDQPVPIAKWVDPRLEGTAA